MVYLLCVNRYFDENEEINMFEYVRLKNYKCFGDIEFNMVDKNGKPKNLLLIYGKNGVGKSNLASSFFMLTETMRTMDVRDFMQKLLSDFDGLKNEDLSEYFKKRYKDIETLIKEYKLVGSEEPMCVEFGFQLDEKRGSYVLETNDTQIIHERLEYTISKNRGVYFDITPDKMIINPKLVNENSAYQEIKNACNKYWGKHSLLSIILHESDDKADVYIKEQISENFRNVLDFLSGISCRVKIGSYQESGTIGSTFRILRDFEEGFIPKNKEKLLDRAEKMLNAFFSQTYSNVRKVYYKKKFKEDRINYKLMFSNYIAGKERDVEVSLESTGTQSILQMLPFMLMGVGGSVAVIDEFDTALHDLMVESLVTSLNEHLDGQFILTTHNTGLMESDIPKESIYVINELNEGNKEVRCITHYDSKIHKNTNKRSQYIHGYYQGVPSKTLIDFSSLLSILTVKD